jgi:hypothetical protein
MYPSRPEFRVPVVDVPGYEDAVLASHDAVSAWLLRGVAGAGFSERLLARARPQMADHGYHFTGLELEPALCNARGDVVGFADALFCFTEGIRLWVEIKTDDKAIGALVRQVKMYRRLIKGDCANWLAILPHASDGAKEFLAHAGIGSLIVAPEDIPSDLYSLTARLEARTALDAIPSSPAGH